MNSATISPGGTLGNQGSNLYAAAVIFDKQRPFELMKMCSHARNSHSDHFNVIGRSRRDAGSDTLAIVHDLQNKRPVIGAQIDLYFRRIRVPVNVDQCFLRYPHERYRGIR